MDSSDEMKNKKEIQKELKNNVAILQCAQEFGLVGDPTRMKICWLLCKQKELSVGEIAELLNVSTSVVSHSLKQMRQRNMVTTRREHKHIFYSLTNTNLNRILKKSLTKL